MEMKKIRKKNILILYITVPVVIILYLISHFSLSSRNSITNPHNYEYIINPGIEACGQVHEKDLTIVAVVAISPENFVQRETIRKTWANKTLFRNIKTIFLTGVAKNKMINQLLLLESRKHNDIVQENFLDTYYNLTLKTIMGLKWVSKYCSKAKFTLKIDDDMVVNTPLLIDFLESLDNKEQNFFIGNQIEKSKVLRDKDSKWYVPLKEYIHPYYIPYHSGSAYIMSTKLVEKFYQLSLKTKLFRFEDVYIGILATKINVNMINIGDLYEIDEYVDDSPNDILFVYIFEKSNFIKIWSKLKKNLI